MARFVVASADENSDLFWAIRGGGGNFGVVTSFLFQAHPVKMVCAGPMLWELDQAADIMKWYREFIAQAPEEINGFFAFMTVPPGPPFPEKLALQEDVRHRLVLQRPAGTGQRNPRAAAQLPAVRRSNSSLPCRFPCCRACSTGFIRPACSGTGRRTSSTS